MFPPYLAVESECYSRISSTSLFFCPALFCDFFCLHIRNRKSPFAVRRLVILSTVDVVDCRCCAAVVLEGVSCPVSDYVAPGNQWAVRLLLLLFYAVVLSNYSSNVAL